MILVFVVVLTILLIIFNFIFLLFVKQIENGNSISEVPEIKFSILIPFKNEEKNLLRMIKSLNKLIYPKDYYEIIFINDNTTDSSVQIIENNLELKINYKIISADGKLLAHKKGALDIGLRESKHEYIITTDADAEIPNNLLSSYSDKFKQNFDIVFGPTHLIGNKTFASLISQFYNLRNQLLVFSMANLGSPYSAMGSNLAYNKKKFVEIGGYEFFNEVISGDDDLLIREGVKRKFKIGSILKTQNLVKSQSVTNLKSFLNQKARHTDTSNYYLLKDKLKLTIWHLANLISLLLVWFAYLDYFFLVPFTVKLLFDIIVIKSKDKIFLYRFSLSEIIFLQIIYEMLLVINYFNATLKRYSWK